MNMMDWLAGVRQSKVKKAMPALSFPSVSLLGITVRQLIGDPELQAQGMKRVAEEVPSLASVSMMDLSVEAEAFGASIHVEDYEVPTVVGALITDEDEAQALSVPAVGAGRTGLYVEAIRRACQYIQDRPVFAGIIGPFSLAGRLMDVSEALVNCYAEPDMVHIAMEKTTEFLIQYALAYKAAGAQGVVMAEPLTGLLSPELAAEFSEPYVRKIVEAVQTPEFIVIYHNCGGNAVLMAESIQRTGAAAYHFGDAISMADMLPKFPEDTLVMGNISPSAQFLNGTPDSIYAATQALMGALCPKYPNFLISSGCDIPPSTSWDNIHAFFKAVGDYYAAQQ